MLYSSRRRARLADVPAPTVAAIRERNLLDLELYSMAATRFAEFLREHPIAAAEMRAFRRRSRAFAPPAPASRWTMAAVRP